MYSPATRAAWLQQAELLKPRLVSEPRPPRDVIQILADEEGFQGWRTEVIAGASTIYDRSWGRSEGFVLDFGDYLVGHLEFELAFEGAMDAPARLKLTFAEVPVEAAEPFDPYTGSLSRAWLQDEIINLDTLPAKISLPRRYAFRYLKVELINVSGAYWINFANIVCRTVTSADYATVPALPAGLPQLAQDLDAVSLRTLASCMQTVFEDGPKRDRRLWLGDLRLQALANYVSFQNYDLVKRCLYLFAGLAHESGLISACVFEFPEPYTGHCNILDYAVLFAPTLLEYAEASGDWDAARELWPVAFRQLEGVLEFVGEDGLFTDPGNWWIFVDWQASLHKETAMHAIIIYCLRQGVELAGKLGLESAVRELADVRDRMTMAARSQLLDHESGCFVSGPEQQISWASQVWMILAGVVSPEEGAGILTSLPTNPHAVKPAGPYLYHYVVDAMLHCGLQTEARSLLESYWGEMLRLGADTFWEVFDPENQFLSPYQSHLINSYCHAWSCTPAYFVRRFPELSLK